MQIYQIILVLFLSCSLEASILLETVYGQFTIDDPLTIELIKAIPSKD